MRRNLSSEVEERLAGAKFTIKVMFDLGCNDNGREVGMCAIVEKTLKS